MSNISHSGGADTLHLDSTVRAAAVRRVMRTRAGVDLSFSTMGFGAAQIGNMGRKLHDGEAMVAIRTAWDQGVRYFDTAPLYGLGLSERRVGAALRGEKRSSYTLSTKVGLLVDRERTGDEHGARESEYARDARHYAFGYDSIMRSFEASLERLDLPSVDILLVHDIDPISHGSAEISEHHIRELLDGGGWRALDELRSGGTVKAIGFGACDWQLSERFLHLLDPDLYLLAGRYTLMEQDAAETFLPECIRRDVKIVIGSPFNSGILATGPVPRARYEYAEATEWALTRAARLSEVCQRYGIPLAQAALQFPVLHPAVVSIIPGNFSADEVTRNVAMLDRPTPPELWTSLQSEGLVRFD